MSRKCVIAKGGVMTERDIAWTAGILDGEGSICVNKRYNRSSSYELVVTVANTDGKMIDRLHSLWGGHTCIIPEKGNWRAKKHHRIQCRMAQRMLVACLDDLTTKRRHAILALVFQRRASANMGNTGRGHTPREAGIRSRIYWRIRALNARGVRAHRELNHETV